MTTCQLTVYTIVAHIAYLSGARCTNSLSQCFICCLHVELMLRIIRVHIILTLIFFKYCSLCSVYCKYLFFASSLNSKGEYSTITLKQYMYVYVLQLIFINIPTVSCSSFLQLCSSSCSLPNISFKSSMAILTNILP